jgi:hypothetical protein
MNPKEVLDEYSALKAFLLNNSLTRVNPNFVQDPGIDDNASEEELKREKPDDNFSSEWAIK